jgi:hypothetical protein
MARLSSRFPTARLVEAVGKKGQAVFTPAQTHNPENTGDTPFDVLVIELKGK